MKPEFIKVELLLLKVCDIFICRNMVQLRSQEFSLKYNGVSLNTLEQQLRS